MKLLMLKGLPASGKTTYAHTLVDKGGWKRVNKDDLRAMLDNGKWSKQNEQMIIDIRDKLILAGLIRGYNVVVDDTNFNPKHETELRELVTVLSTKPDEYTFEVYEFHTPPEECIRRDLARPNSVGSKVIMQMYNQYVAPTIAPYIADKTLPRCIIVDIDGTLAHMVGRSPYEWHRVGEDSCDEEIASLVRRYHNSSSVAPCDVILVSGRSEACRTITQYWLAENKIPYEALYMRPEGDSSPDTRVKLQIFNEHIRGKYRVKFVLDDRDRVVDMWRSMGLKVLQVAPGSF